jgi:exonuclease SbcC
MIPVSLYLKNFLSYGDNVPPLDFSEFSVACLSGDNGHGKSALLDAMTWVLWGEARKAVGEKSPSDGLLRIGATEMQVEFVFDLEGDRYRLLRKYQRKKTRKGVPSLDFQVFDETTQGYKSLTEGNISSTQVKINSILRMDYETFINSAFILQGRADEFTKRNPTQRKAILADILDLSQYEALRELAKEHHRQAKTESELLERQLQVIREELSHKKAYEQILDELTQKLTDVDQKLAEHDARRQHLENRRAELGGKQQQLSYLQQQQKQSLKDKAQLDNRIARQEQQIAEVTAILAQEEEILTTYSQFVELTAQNSAYEEKRRQKSESQLQQSELEKKIQRARHELEKALEKQRVEQAQKQHILDEARQFLHKEREIDEGFRELRTCLEQGELWDEQRNKVEALEHSLRQLEQEISQKKHQLDAQLQMLEQRIAELRKIANTQDANEKKVQKYQEAVTQLKSLEKQLEATKDAGTECKTQLEHLETQKKQLQEKQQDLAKKVELLRQSDTPQCPVCKSDLNAQKKAEIEYHFNEEKLALQQQEAQTVQVIQECLAHREECATQYKQIKTQIDKLTKSREQLIEAEHALQESRKAQEHIAELNTQADRWRMQIQTKAYAQEEQQQVAELQKQKEALGYDAKAHQTLKHKLKTLRKFEGEHSRLEDSRRRQREASNALPAIEQEIKRINTALAHQEYAQKEHAELQDVLSRIAAIGYDEQVHDQVKQNLQRIQNAPIRKEQLDQAHKSIKHLRQTFDELLAERRQKNEQIAGIQEQMKALERELEVLPAVERDLKEVYVTLDSLKKGRDDLLQQRGTYQNKYEHCKQLETESGQLEAKKQETEKNRNIYEKLMQIFSKDGIQAYLIENAIPEIEDEANAILSRLTDNRTNIAIESVKDLKSGGTRETLDIKISDELGTRSYEMYSGGEAFRVDFAIRIALSKLLANRAGTKLKTLVIDEGFGTQDARGLEQLVEAIKAISSDFEKILVITHLDALKEAFPVKIEVVKLPDIGSQYQIVH